MSTSLPRDPNKAKHAPEVPDDARLETLEEIRRAILAQREAAQQIPAEDDAIVFRPRKRPPMAMLCILDDGRDDGEWVRLRNDLAIIGRAEGDVIIPHDAMMSSQHVRLARYLERGQYRWYLTDLQSTNGTYVRIGNATIKHNQEFLIGSQRYRFDAAPQGSAVLAEAIVEKEEAGGTRYWEKVSPADVLPSLVEQKVDGEGKRFFLTKAENWIGRDASSCAVVLKGDPLVSQRHARLYRDNRGRWHIENMGSLNGIWLRIDHVPIDAACQFQIGEQQFLVRVL